MGNHGQVHLQQILAALAQLLNEVQRVENGQEHIPLAKHIVEVKLTDLIAIIADVHAAFPAGAGQLMVRAGFVHKAHTDGNIGVALVVQAVNTALPKKGQAGDDESDGIGDARFTTAVTSGNDGGISEHQLSGALVGLEAGNVQAGNLKLLDLFQMTSPFFF